MKIVPSNNQNIKNINLVLKNIEIIRRYCKVKKEGITNYWKDQIPKEIQSIERVEAVIEYEIKGEGEQGAEGLSYEIYKLPFDDLYLKLIIKTDSYGDNERITGMEFVKPVEKQVTVFESFK